jgi:hypothetical protein
MNHPTVTMKRLSAAVENSLPDALFLIGAGLVSYGAYMIYAPAGFVTCGLFSILAGVLAAKGAK